MSASSRCGAPLRGKTPPSWSMPFPSPTGRPFVSARPGAKLSGPGMEKRCISSCPSKEVRNGGLTSFPYLVALMFPRFRSREFSPTQTCRIGPRSKSGRRCSPLAPIRPSTALANAAPTGTFTAFQSREVARAEYRLAVSSVCSFCELCLVRNPQENGMPLTRKNQRRPSLERAYRRRGVREFGQPDAEHLHRRLRADHGLLGVRTESCWNDCLKEEELSDRAPHRA